MNTYIAGVNILVCIWFIAVLVKAGSGIKFSKNEVVFDVCIVWIALSLNFYHLLKLNSL